MTESIGKIICLRVVVPGLLVNGRLPPWRRKVNRRLSDRYGILVGRAEFKIPMPDLDRPHTLRWSNGLVAGVDYGD